PIRGRENLDVRVHADVDRILFDNENASGIVYRQNGSTRRARASKEVILCAGAINSPKLLMLSGIGPAEELQRHGIAVRHHAPRLGKNLHDHIDVSVKMACEAPVSKTPLLLWYRMLLIGMQWILFKSGPGVTNHFEAAGFYRDDPALDGPNFQIYFVPMLVNYDLSRLRYRHGYQTTGMLGRPRSRGELLLGSSDPRDTPRLRFNYLVDPYDGQALCGAIKLMRKIFSQPAFGAFGSFEVAPGPDVRSDAEIMDFVKATAKTTHHPAGTCAMGTAADTVTDPEGRVRGVGRLRVVDASIVPILPATNLNAPTIMLAEKIVDRMAH
ncbi:MAG: GMC oxidoreductase, partial [Pseudorhodoplanes sp.]